jgi:hypothetical protein
MCLVIASGGVGVVLYVRYPRELSANRASLTRDQLTAYFFNPSAELRSTAYRELYRVYIENSTILAQIYIHRLRDWYAEGVELRGKTLGVVGIGRIGQATAKMALGLGMKVIAADSFIENGNLFSPLMKKEQFNILQNATRNYKTTDPNCHSTEAKTINKSEKYKLFQRLTDNKL